MAIGSIGKNDSEVEPYLKGLGVNSISIISADSMSWDPLVTVRYFEGEEQYTISKEEMVDLKEKLGNIEGTTWLLKRTKRLGRKFLLDERREKLRRIAG